jgi:Lysylphosphatidylglycerol synthase TM region
MAFVEPEPGVPGADDGDAGSGEGGRPSLLRRVLLARKQRSPGLLIFAVVLFVVFTVVAFRALPPIDRPIRWDLILITGLVCVPASTALNALEYRVMAHFADHHPPALEIVQVSVLGTAANLLPVPGAVVVRLANLRKGGVRMTRALNLTAIIGLTWVGSACVLGGIANLVGHAGFGVVALAVGFALMTVTMILLARTLERGTRLAGSIELVAIEAGFALVSALRLFLVAAALRFDVSFAQATALMIAAVTAAAIGFLPSGLGVREGIAAILSPIVGMPAAVGLVITAVERVIGLVVLSVFAAIVTFVTRKQRHTADTG